MKDISQQTELTAAPWHHASELGFEWVHERPLGLVGLVGLPAAIAFMQGKCIFNLCDFWYIKPSKQWGLGDTELIVE